eukprot:gnl/Dysnectes_brevis/658_a726_2867.p1 GENE.gnl/Dysnectes_brevis/658_a726_2867~~gnl/Dysnectes_brevis/658_a726_2867.p1  ORF type:complete len:378 (-),score=132.92 gnl/Dysnectes_brevis/658_a726_2867:110-1243(-)
MERSVFNIKGTRFVVPSYYQVKRAIGHGAYGVVAEGIDVRTGEKVAIKKVSNLFSHMTDSKRTLREISILKYFSHENIIQLHDILAPEDPRSFNSLYIVTNLMQTDMHHIITSKQSLSIEHVQYFLYQLLRGLKYVHSAGVIHRDLKPSNLLLNSNCDLSICDFGLARLSKEQTEKGAPGAGDQAMTEYVATRWYRAPEILLGSTRYSKAVDAWAIGAILGELLGGKPMFPGSSTMNQLDKIIEITGRPTAEDIEAVQSPFAATMLESLPPSKPRSLTQMYPGASPEALDLLRRFLQFNPSRRITADEALRHPYVARFHNPSHEPRFSSPVEIMVDDDEKRSTAEYRDLLYSSILQRKKEMRAKAMKRKRKREGVHQ